MNKVAIFDLDNTLIFTDDLNNCSYKYAMRIMGLNTLNHRSRITKKDILKHYPTLNRKEFDDLLSLKMSYYGENLNKTKLNVSLVNLLKTLDSHIIVLWTAANQHRANLLLIEYDLVGYFDLFYYSDKEEVCDDINNICSYFNADKIDLCVYEDNDTTIEQLSNYGVRVVDVKNNQ